MTKVIKKYKLPLSSNPLALTNEDILVKNGDLLGLWNSVLNMDKERISFQGLYWKGMRHLSNWSMFFGNAELLPLTSLPSDQSRSSSPYFNRVRLLGPPLSNFLPSSPKDTMKVDGPLLIDRRRFSGPFWVTEEVSIYNHVPFPINVPLVVYFYADFKDIMDVRGIRTKIIPSNIKSEYSIKKKELLFTYSGQDTIVRKTLISIHGLSPEWNDGQITALLTILPRCRLSFKIRVELSDLVSPTGHPMKNKRDTRKSLTVSSNLRMDQRDSENFQSLWPKIDGSGLPIAKWANNAIDDIRVLLTPTQHGIFPYAGVPWFSTPFGRDALITGFSTLWAFPALSRSVLLFLAAMQAKEINPFRDSEPGKILHEFRYGEAGADPSIPFGLYYGSVDSTPLFIALSWAYYARTKDKHLLEFLRPAIVGAMNWIEKYGLHPESGFLVYSSDPKKGLIQKGWKDSGDSVFHSSGELAKHPIALSEVQGYLYMAYQGFGEIMKIYKDFPTAELFEKKARNLKRRFNEIFWSKRINMFSLAIDGDMNPCEVRTSNAGHLLISGIANLEYARKTAHELLEGDMFSGWGIRTLSSKEKRYNPVSYHNGSVWPHDNAIIMAGFSKYGLNKELSILAQAYFNTLPNFPAERPPELYCGFSKEDIEGPLSYPTSCRIQSWSVASFFMTVQSIANLWFDGIPTPHFKNAILPSEINKLLINNIPYHYLSSQKGIIEINRIEGKTYRNFLIEDISRNDLEA